jgi:hypothetical protein
LYLSKAQQCDGTHLLYGVIRIFATFRLADDEVAPELVVDPDVINAKEDLVDAEEEAGEEEEAAGHHSLWFDEGLARAWREAYYADGEVCDPAIVQLVLEERDFLVEEDGFVLSRELGHRYGSYRIFLEGLLLWHQ